MWQLVKSILSWFVDILPDFSNLVLVLVGVVMSFPKLASDVEENRKTRLGLAAICLAFGVTGFYAGVYQRHQATADIRHLISDDDRLLGNTSTLVGSTTSLVDKTDDEVSNTNNLIRTVSLLIPKINGLGSQVSQIQFEIDQAKGDARQTATLKAQLDSVQKDYNAAKEQLALALAQIGSSPTSSMKADGLQLSREILEWIDTVSKDMPPRSSSGLGTPQEQEQNRKYIERLDSEWIARFNYRANYLVGQLHVTGLVMACRPIGPDQGWDASAILNFRRTCAGHISKAAMAP